ncbi:MAG TPA: DNA polymerase Y family protein [Candidatus Binatia bacterium]|nr:DNA polymerase Y family protein [Candidatus Binatia bacterium]
MAFASLFVPDFPVQAAVRLEPELRNKPVAILAGAPPMTKVYAVNREGRKAGVEAGMTKVQAEAFKGVVWRWRSLSQEATAYAALLDCAWTISPRVDEGPKRENQDFRDTVVLDIAGCEKLFGSPEKIAHDLQRVASDVGLEANVAVAGNPLAAICAAQGFSGTTVIPAGEEGLQLGRLSLEALRIPFEFVETLCRWGIRTCADFAALPEVAIVERLGQEGLRWWRLAQGADDQPLIAKDFPSNFEEHMDLDSPVELLEPLRFVLNRLLEQLCARLQMHILSIGEIQVTLSLERSDSRRKEPVLHIRTLRLPVPTRDSKLLLKLLQLDLEAHPPSLPVTAVRMLTVPLKARSRQLGLFLPLSPDPERLEVTLARIQSTIGEGRVGAPVLLDTHSPESFRQNRFVLPEVKEKQLSCEKGATTAMRIYRPPLPATVESQKGKPAFLICEGVRSQVLAFAGPWKTKGGWWSESAWAREEWDVEVRTLRPRIRTEGSRDAQEETALYRVYKDLRRKRWFVEGVYD